MKIGFTYDLKEDYLKKGYSQAQVAELDSIETIEGIAQALTKCNFAVDYIGNVDNLLNAITNGKRWPLVFNICEGIRGSTRESQVPSILEIYNIPYVFSDSLALAITLNKDIAKSVVANHKIATAPFCSVNAIEDLKNVDLTYPLFIKPNRGGTGMGISHNSIVTNKEELTLQSNALIANNDNPILIESYLSGREFTVGLIGTGKNATAIGAMEIVVNKTEQQGIYSYKSKQEYKKWVAYKSIEPEIEKECKEIALDVWQVLNCFDGGRVDLKMDGKGKLYFLEINPLAGLNPIDSDLPILAALYGISYQNLIKMIMKSACERLKIKHEF